MATETFLNGSVWFENQVSMGLWPEIKPHVAASKTDKNIFITQYFKF